MTTNDKALFCCAQCIEFDFERVMCTLMPEWVDLDNRTLVHFCGLGRERTKITEALKIARASFKDLPDEEPPPPPGIYIETEPEDIPPRGTQG